MPSPFALLVLDDWTLCESGGVWWSLVEPSKYVLLTFDDLCFSHSLMLSKVFL